MSGEERQIRCAIEADPTGGPGEGDDSPILPLIAAMLCALAALLPAAGGESGRQKKKS